MKRADQLSDCLSEIRREPKSEHSWRTFYRLAQPAITIFLRYLGANPENAKDLTQQVFLIFLERSPWSNNWSKLPPDGKTLVSWLKTVARNLFIDEMRSTKREVFTLGQVLENEEFQTGSRAGFESKEINLILPQLEPEEQLLLVYRLMGFNLRQIADILEISESAVGTRFHRLKKKIQKM